MDEQITIVSSGDKKVKCLVLLFSWNIGSKTFSVRSMDGKLSWRIDYTDIYRTTYPHAPQWFSVLEKAMDSLDADDVDNNAKYTEALQLWRVYRRKILIDKEIDKRK